MVDEVAPQIAIRASNLFFIFEIFELMFCSFGFDSDDKIILICIFAWDKIVLKKG